MLNNKSVRVNINLREEEKSAFLFGCPLCVCGMMCHKTHEKRNRHDCNARKRTTEPGKQKTKKKRTGADEALGRGFVVEKNKKRIIRRGG